MGSKQQCQKDEGKYFELDDAIDGQVVVRFPPEASGYLHIGHAKAALLNAHYQQYYHGKLIFRFDDTNPEKEKESFEKIIEGDVELLGIKPDQQSWTSDYFDLMLIKAEEMIRSFNAYVDDTDPEQMKIQREQKIESKNRQNSIEKNLQMWNEMVTGSDIGQKYCLRAKIDMKSDNGALRDPTIYRCKLQEHPRTKNKYCVYPTYDFACPIVDSIEGVTHALRTSEYMDRDAQYYWFCEAMNIRKPLIAAYSRLNLMNTVLSKRKLTYFVEQKLVDGWDDPRMPTVRGILRRGLTVEGLKNFIASQGSSKAVVVMDWDKIWSFNRKVIDPISPRYSAVEKYNMVPVLIEDDLLKPDETITVALHPKNPDLGQRQLPIGKRLLIDQTDAQLIQANTSVTFINWGNIRIKSVEKNADGIVTAIMAKLDLENKDFKKTLKVTWLEDRSKISASLVYYDHIIKKPVLGKNDDFKQFLNLKSKMIIDAFVDGDMKSLTRKQIIQIQRKGFFICDSPFNASDNSSLCLISIPDGSTDVKIFPQAIQDWKRENLWVDTDNVINKCQNSTTASVEELDVNIRNQGDLIRKLKSEKASKEEIKAQVDKLLALKDQFKQVSGVNWTPEFQPADINSSKALISSANDLNGQICQQGDLIRKLKGDKADKKQIDEQVEILLKLKSQYKNLTGSEWKPSTSANVSNIAKKKSECKPESNENKKNHSSQKKIDSTNSKVVKKQSRLGMEIKKGDNYSEWYTEVITKAEMIDYYDVSGCYILRPWAFSIWEKLQQYFDQEIKKLGVENCYFPIFISKSALETEKTHIADFAPEVAWVTKSGTSDLSEPIAIRPTSETVIYPSYAKWVQSHRDLPLRLNQWCNVIRWEFKQPTPFLRTREFLWQEGHSAFATEKETLDEVYKILELYTNVYEKLLAIPVIPGHKTEKEKFAGAQLTATCEAYVHVNGRGIQGATSHFLGQNFSKMFGMQFEDPDQPGQKRFAYQASWGMSTRTIGAMVMIHGDDKGLVLPPKVASKQIVIIPCGITSSTPEVEKNHLILVCNELLNRLKNEGQIRATLDDGDHYSPGWKFNHWELKGVPIRIELGPKDLASNRFVAVRRDTGIKESYDLLDAPNQMLNLLDKIQNDMFENAKALMKKNLVVTESWATLLEKLECKAIIMAPFCGRISCEDNIKKDSTKDEMEENGTTGPLMGAKSLCIPIEQPKPITPDTKCVHPSCDQKAKFYTLFGRSY